MYATDRTPGLLKKKTYECGHAVVVGYWDAPHLKVPCSPCGRAVGPEDVVFGRLDEKDGGLVVLALVIEGLDRGPVAVGRVNYVRNACKMKRVVLSLMTTH